MPYAHLGLWMSRKNSKAPQKKKGPALGSPKKKGPALGPPKKKGPAPRPPKKERSTPKALQKRKVPGVPRGPGPGVPDPWDPWDSWARDPWELLGLGPLVTPETFLFWRA